MGDEIALRDRIISELNADSTFRSVACLKAQAPKGDYRAIVHITSDCFSLTGEFLERPNTGDFTVATTGTAAVVVAFDTIKSRGKSTSLARDPNNPHRLGVLGISGSVTVSPQSVEDLFEEYLKNGTSYDMTVNGSVTPVIFEFTASTFDPTGNFNLFVQNISAHGQDNGIKYGQFLGRSTLSNGVLVEAVTEAGITTITKVLDTEDFKHEFTRGIVANYSFEQAPGTDDIVASFNVSQTPILLRAGTTDKIRVTIRDNLTSVLLLHFTVNGFKKEV